MANWCSFSPDEQKKINNLLATYIALKINAGKKIDPKFIIKEIYDGLIAKNTPKDNAYKIVANTPAVMLKMIGMREFTRILLPLGLELDELDIQIREDENALKGILFFNYLKASEKKTIIAAELKAGKKITGGLSKLTAEARTGLLFTDNEGRSYYIYAHENMKLAEEAILSNATDVELRLLPELILPNGKTYTDVVQVYYKGTLLGNVRESDFTNEAPTVPPAPKKEPVKQPEVKPIVSENNVPKVNVEQKLKAEETPVEQVATNPKEVILKNYPKGAWSQAIKDAQDNKGIWVLRPNDKVPLPENEHYGNPWSPPKDNLKADVIVVPDDGTAAQNYKKWLAKEDFLDIQPERRDWILKQIADGVLDGKTLIYFKPGEKSGQVGTYYSHADVLTELANSRRSEVEPVQAPVITAAISIGPETKINVYSSDKNGFESLSNFANRPFTDEDGANWNSVEQYYQYAKSLYSMDVLYASRSTATAKDKEDATFNDKLSDKIANSSNSAEIKKLGSQFKQLDTTKWDNGASKIMKEALLMSFQQNPDALAKLLSTGNATLTHNSKLKPDKWTTEFPRLLMEVREELRGKQAPVAQTPVSTTNNPAEYTNHSGGAYGGDTFWDLIGREFGVTEHKHYREENNTRLSAQLKKAGVIAEVLTKEQMDNARAEVERILGKKYPDTTEGNLQVRNYYQVANSDAVFAIAELNSDDNGVKGGTNTAVQLGIKLNKPVYVWDIDTKSWYKWNGNSFEITKTPVLTKNFAGVGSRDIESYNVPKEGKWQPREQYKGKEVEEAAKQAIRDVYENTLGKKEVVTEEISKKLAPIQAPKIEQPEGKDFFKTISGIKLDKNKNQKSMNEALGKEKADEAEKWYKNTKVTISVVDPKTGKLKKETTTLAKLWDLKLLFNAINTENPHSVATFFGNQITLYKGSDFTDVYHEAWHGFTQSMLTDKQYEELVAEVKSQKGSFVTHTNQTVEFKNATPLEIEEYLAEEFRKFALSDGKHKLKGKVTESIFTKILNWLKGLFSGVTKDDVLLAPMSVPMVYEMFNNLYTGNLDQYTFQQIASGKLFDKLVIDPSTNQEILTVQEWGLVRETIDYVVSSMLNAADVRQKESFENFITVIKGVHDDLLGAEKTGSPEIVKEGLVDFIKNNPGYSQLLQDDQTEIEKFADKVMDPRQQDTLNPDKRYTHGLLKTRKGQNAVFGAVRDQLYNDLVKAADDFNTKYADKELSDSDLQKAYELKDKIDLLTKVVTSFSDNEADYSRSKKGVIASYIQSSNYLSYEEKYLVEEDDKPGEKIGEKKSQEKSLEDAATADVKNLMRGLVLYEGDRVVYNKLGYPKLVPSKISFYEIGTMLENSLGTDDMIQKLTDHSTENTIKGSLARQLLARLGPADSPNPLVQSAWSSFTTAFFKTRLNLRIAKVELKTIHKDKQNEDDQTKDDVEIIFKSSNASFINSEVERRFNDFIQTVPEAPFIKKDANGINEIDVEGFVKKYFFVAEKGVDKGKYIIKTKAVAANPLEYLRDMGIILTDNEAVRKALAEYINEPYSKFFQLSNNILSVYLNKISKQKKSYIPASINSYYDLKKNQGSDYGRLVDIEIRHGETTRSLMVETAKGEVNFLHSENSSLLNQINAINSSSVSNVAELSALPGMHIFNPFTHKMLKGNLIFGSIFDTAGNRIIVNNQTNKIVVENYNGLQFTNANGQFGLSSFELNNLDRLFMDVETWYRKGFSAGVQHEAKSSTFRMGPENIIINGKKQKYYIDHADFTNWSRADKRDGSKASEQIVNLAVSMLERELYRVSLSRQIEKDAKSDDSVIREAAQNNPNYRKRVYEGKTAKRYTEVGSEFAAFRDVLTTEVQNELKELNYADVERAGGLLAYLDTLPELRTKVSQDIKEYFTTKAVSFADNVKNRYLPAGGSLDSLFSKEMNSKYTTLMAFWVNDWIHKHELVNLFYGDLITYNHLKNEFNKRDAAIAATKLNPRYDSGFLKYINNSRLFENYINATDKMFPNQTVSRVNKALALSTIQNNPFDGIYNSAILKDPMSKSIYYNILVDHLTKEIMQKKKISKAAAKKEATSKLDAYENMKEADAQGWITLPAYRLISEAIGGKWSKAQGDLYNQIIEGNVQMGLSEFLEFFPVKKMQMAGPLMNEDGGIALYAFHKFSLLPLLPGMINDNSVLKSMHDRMIEQNVHYSVVASGSKLGHYAALDKTADEFYVGDINNRSSAFKNKDYKFTINKVHSLYFGEQVATGESYKKKVTFSTQLKKLVEIGLFEYGVPKDYKPEITDPIERAKLINKWNTLPKEEKEKSKDYVLSNEYILAIKNLEEKLKAEVREEFGLDENYNPKTTSRHKIYDKIRETLIRKNYSDVEISAIIPGKDLSTTPNAKDIERVVMNVVNKKILNPKLNGEALILAASTGFELELEAAGYRPDFTNPSEDDLTKYGTDGLASYTPKYDASGNIIGINAMKVKVALQGNFKKLLDHADVIKRAAEKGIDRITALNELIKEDEWLDKYRDLITLTGVRIPVQGPNSMEIMEVWEFLPEDAGNIIIPPIEIVAKAGSDFDIDKLTVLMPNLINYDGSVELVPTKLNVPESFDSIREAIKSAKRNIRLAYETYDNKLESLEDSGLLKLSKDQKTQLSKIKKKRDTVLETLQNKLTQATTEQEIEDLEDQIDVIKENYYKENNDLYSSFRDSLPQVMAIAKERDNTIAAANKEIEGYERKLAAKGSKGAQNRVFQIIKDIVLRPDNFSALYLPNGTYLLDKYAKGSEEENIALEDYTREYDLRQGLRSKSKGSAVIPTKTLEYEFQEAMRNSNNIGMAALGINATENTINVAFNKVGMYVNPASQYRRGEDIHRHALLFEKYNTVDATVDLRVKIDKNKYETRPFTYKSISLAGLRDARFIDDIPEIISQSINGYVDIAKDAWIFDLQADKFVAPTLFFLIQAGVPAKEAIYFISQPIVREYIRKKKDLSGLRADIYDHIASGKYWENERAARVAMVNDPYYKKNFQNREIAVGSSEQGITLFMDKGMSNVIAAYEQNPTKLTGLDVLEKNIVENKDKTQRGQNDVDILIHFMHIEDMANGIGKIKNNLAFDTKLGTSFYDILKKESKLEKLESNKFIPDGMIEKLMAETAQGVINPGKLAIDMFGKTLLPFRTDERILNYISELIDGERSISTGTQRRPTQRSFNNDDSIRTSLVFEDPQAAYTEYINQLIPFIFQNTLSTMNTPNAISELNNKYKGYEISDAGTITEKGQYEVRATRYVKLGAWVKDGKIYLDRDILGDQYKNSLYTNKGIEQLNESISETGIKLAGVESTFLTEDEYIRFVIERELTRSLYDKPEKYEKLYEYTKEESKLKQMNAAAPAENKISNEELYKKAYENFIRNMALKNTYNFDYFFKGSDSYADRYMEIKSMVEKERINNPQLKEYTIFDFLSRSISMGKTIDTTIKTLTMSTSTMTADEVLDYNAQLAKLQNSSVVKFKNKEFNNYVSDFFKQFSIYAFLQSGQSGMGRTNLNKLIGHNTAVQTLLEQPKKYIDQQLDENILSVYTKAFYRVFSKNNARNSYGVKDWRLNNQNDIKTLMKKGVDAKITASEYLKIRYNSEIQKYGEYTFPKYRLTGQDRVNTDTVLKTVSEKSNYMLVYEKGLSKMLASNPNYLADNIKDNTTKPLSLTRGIESKYGDGPVLVSTEEGYNKMVALVDSQIDSIVADMLNNNRIPIFNSEGYGQDLINPPTTKTLSKEDIQKLSTYNKALFDHLSSRLFKEFGYQNPGYYLSEVSSDILESFTPVSDKDVREFISKCYKK